MIAQTQFWRLHLAFLTVALAACGGGGGRNPSAAPNSAPTFVVAESVTVAANESSRATLSISDDQTSPDVLAVSVATLDHSTLFAAGGLQIDGSGAVRDVVFLPVPDTLGEARVALTVTDGAGLMSRREVRVRVVAQRLDLAEFVRTQFATAEPDGGPAPINAIDFVDVLEGDEFVDLLEPAS